MKNLFRIATVVIVVVFSINLFSQKVFQFRTGRYVDTTGRASIFIGIDRQYVELWNNQRIGDDRYYIYDQSTQTLRTFFRSNNEFCSVHRVVYDSTPGKEKLIYLYPDRSITYYHN
mgnify:CR=1 FL=1